MTDQRLCAVIPAAGIGSRLGLNIPKIMLEVAENVTVWHVLFSRLRPFVRHVHVIVSPVSAGPFQELVADDIASGAVSVSIQSHPRGMGDAIFGAGQHWDSYDGVFIVWGDQANLSPVTVGTVVRSHQVAASRGRPVLTIPLVSMTDPYVEYEFSAGSLVRVRMSREGDQCRPGGLSDVGVFCLSTRGLASAWTRHRTDSVPGAATGEANFLPLLPRLSLIHDWHVNIVPVVDPDEARGINSKQDLEFIRKIFARQCSSNIVSHHV